jgi:hypothetical protein
VSTGRPLPLPPSGISVWRPLSSGEGGVVAILGSGPSEGGHESDEDVQCVWCGLRSRPAAACEVCGSPLYESVAIWQPAKGTPVQELPTPVRNQPRRSVAAPSRPTKPEGPSFWPATETAASSRAEPAAGPAPSQPAQPESPSSESQPKDTVFKAFKRFAGLEIHWVRRGND